VVKSAHILIKGVNMELIGHKNEKERIKIALNSAKHRNKALPHLLLSGAAGCGKTTTAQWLATIGGYEYLPASPLSLKTKKDVYSLLEKLNVKGYNETGDRIGVIKPTILFFDEIHQMPVIAQEILGLAMERFILEADIPNKLIWLPYFTIVGATTDDGKLTKPFRDRFKLKFIFEPYKNNEMMEIVKFHAAKQKLIITKDAIVDITKRSKGVPRVMVNYLETIRDVMLNKGSTIITKNLTEEAFSTIGIDRTGLSKIEIKILKSLFDANGAIGLDNLSIITNESPKTIAQTLEPFLIQRGLLLRTGKGRSITEKGTKYLEVEGHLKNKQQSKTFIDTSYIRN